MEKENGEWDEEQKRDEAFAIKSLSLIMTAVLYILLSYTEPIIVLFLFIYLGRT